MTKLIHISDLHLSRTHAYFYENWRAVASYINNTQPDLVVCTGDYVLDSPDDAEDLSLGRQEMNRLTVPWKSLAGDHDIGGGPPQPRLRPEVPWLEHYMVTEERRQYYLELFGEDHWAMPFADWYLIGINDLIFESGFPAESDQWDFLEDHIATAGNAPIALFMHKPPCVTTFNEDHYTSNAIPAKARGRLRKILAGTNVRLIATGHLHVYRTLQTAGITVVTAPTLMRGKDDYPSKNGYVTNGIIEYTFDGDGVEFRLVEPEGVTRPTLPKGARHNWDMLPVEELRHD